MSDVVQDGWQVIADAAEIIDGIPSVLRRFGETIVLWRDPTGTIRAEHDACPHGGGLAGDPCLDCLIDPAHTPAAAPVIREAYGWVWMWRGAPRRRYPAPDYFASVEHESRHRTSRFLRGPDEVEVWTNEPDPHRLSNLRLNAISPRRGRVTAVVPVDGGHVAVYQRTYRPPGGLLTWVRDTLHDLLGRRRLPRAGSRATAG